MIKEIGIVGAVIVSVSNIPQLVLFYRTGNAKGISVLGNWVGLIGVSFRTIYLYSATKGDIVALGPYFFAIACILFTKYYIYFPRKE